MKKASSLLLIPALLYYLIGGFTTSAIEQVDTAFNQTEQTMHFASYMFNSSIMFIYLLLIHQTTDEQWHMRFYIATRGSLLKQMYTQAFQLVLLMWGAKQIVYWSFYSTSSTSPFYWFMTLSTLLTLMLVATLQIAIKVRGWSGAIALLVTMSLQLISQYVSYTYPFFALFVVASDRWAHDGLLLLGGKVAIITALIVLSSKTFTFDHLIGVNKHD